MQRSKGYMWRPGLGAEAIRALAAWRDEKAPWAIVMIDNCYGEFVEPLEPGAAGADLIVGSLIKNPGGTLAPGGGYIAGRRDLIDVIADRVTAPGLGLHVGPTLGTARHILQGLYLAPHLVAEALAGLARSYVFEELGYEVTPRWSDPPVDSVLAVRLGSPELLLEFCRSIQAASPVDSDARPEPGPLPGYEHRVVMAGAPLSKAHRASYRPMAPCGRLMLLSCREASAARRSLWPCTMWCPSWRGEIDPHFRCFLDNPWSSVTMILTVTRLPRKGGVLCEHCTPWPPHLVRGLWM